MLEVQGGSNYATRIMGEIDGATSGASLQIENAHQSNEGVVVELSNKRQGAMAKAMEPIKTGSQAFEQATMGMNDGLPTNVKLIVAAKVTAIMGTLLANPPAGLLLH